jgi:DNA-binding transcriptional MerR regulator
MYSADTTPIYNLKAVVQQTGLKPDTLRAWERRYGLPNPQRAESGHRLYSAHDVEVIQWLMERQKDGMSIGRAVDLWNQLSTAESDPLASQGFNGTGSSEVDLRAATEAIPESRADSLRQQWVSACLQFDEQSAEDVLSQAFSLFPVEAVCLSILQTGLAEIGQGWHGGKITVQQEHFASELAMRRLESLLSAMPAPHKRGRILIGCPPEEDHTFPPLLLAVLLRRHGYDVVYLGANVPLRSMEVTIGSTRPRLVIMTAQQLYTAASLLDMAELLQQRRITLAFGGLIFTKIPTLPDRIPGIYLGDSFEAGIETVNEIMAEPAYQETNVSIPPENLAAREHFHQHQSEIEADVWSTLTCKTVPARQLDVANRFMGKNIRAALALGNLNYIGPDLVWIEELLVSYYEMPAVMVNRYLHAYLEAARNRLGDGGKIVIDWFENLLGINQDGSEPDLTRSMADHTFLSEDVEQ